MSDVQESTIPAKEARAKLRESFLRAINELKGERCEILTYEQSTLEGTFKGWKLDGSEIIVNDVNTPAKIKISSALLRTPDVITINFEKDINEKCD